MGLWEITVKDLRLILKDRGALYTLLALPVVFIAILGVSTGELITTHEESKLLKVGIVNENGGPLSKDISKSLSTIGGIKALEVSDRDEAKRWLQDGRSSVVVTIGKDFEERIDELKLRDIFNREHGKLSRGLSVIDIHVQSGVEFVGVTELVEYVVLSSVLRVVAPYVARRSVILRRTIDRMMEDEEDDSPTAATEPQPTAEKPVEPGASIIYQTLVPSFMVMFAFFLINIMASSFINERKLGTLRRLQSSPIGPVQLMWGKTLPFLFVSILQSLILFASGKLMFGMSWGIHPLMLLPVILMTSISATGMGLLLATIVRTESQVASYATFLVIVLAGISGCYMPRAWLPEIMQNASLATPHAWALIAYQELLTREHPQMGLVIKCCGVLATFGIVFFIIGCVRFRRLEYNQ
jgi:ABC-2 type transport system permease protein